MSLRALARQHGMLESTLRKRMRVQRLPLSEALARPVMGRREACMRALDERLLVHSWEAIKRATRLGR